VNLATILAFIQVGGALLPEGAALVAEIKALFGETDQAAIDKALADSTAAADAQHQEAQSL
jgi:hypothetical protein